jgi:NADH-quinone oxidoreductase subunit L
MTLAALQPYSDALLFTAIVAVLVLPLLSFLVSLITPTKYSWLVTFSAPLCLFACVVAAVTTCIGTWSESFEWSVTWMSIANSDLKVGLEVNRSAALMLVVVTLVSFLVHAYSTGYMAGDSAIKRYFGILGLFTFAMLGIVVADSLLLVFVFWELVGFSSYLLIGHWWEKPSAAEAGKRAFIFNRIGDAGFVVGLMLVWSHTGTFHLATLNELTGGWQLAASLCIFCGIVGKSAQFPLLSWLPDAMEGPTPVSALLHAATMVAAGVYLLYRIHFLFPPLALDVVAITGGATALLGAMSALAQSDIKKVLAYSTISQLGFMVMAAGIGAPDAAMLHLFTHALFKAGLFLGAGSVIHAVHQAQSQTHEDFNVQDIRNLGGLRHRLPFTFAIFVICGSALAGLPFFSGFLSKDAILTALIQWSGDSLSWRWLIVAVAFLVSFATVIYTFRMIWSVFAGEGRLTRSLNIEEPPIAMLAPMGALAAGSLWVLFSFNPFSFSGWVFTALGGTAANHAAAVTYISAAWVMLALIIAYVLRQKVIDAAVLTHTFYLDTCYDAVFIRPAMRLGVILQSVDLHWIDRALHLTAYGHLIVAHFSAWIDRVIVDGLVDTIAGSARLTGLFARSFQGGKVQLYVFWALFGLIIFIFWMLL